jgi:UDP-glucuronate 4-epimerase
MSNDVILVTGGSGFIGSHLCERLMDLGLETVNLDSFCDNYDPAIKERNIANLINNPRYHLYRGDIRDQRILDRIFADHSIGIIIHLAALAGVRQSLVKPCDYVSVDVEGSVNLLEYAAKQRIKRFLFGSSSSVYGDNPVPFKEKDRVERPLSPYAAAKLAGGNVLPDLSSALWIFHWLFAVFHGLWSKAAAGDGNSLFYQINRQRFGGSAIWGRKQ